MIFQLILDGVIKDTGVLMPNKKSIYEPILKLLEEAGVRCVETEEWNKCVVQQFLYIFIYIHLQIMIKFNFKLFYILDFWWEGWG